MSFRSNPDMYSFAPVAGECILCFPTGKTPKTMFLSIQGIQIGDDWLSGDPPPPNGLHELTFNGGCLWQLIDATFNFLVGSLLGPWGFLLKSTSGLTFFFNGLESSCTWAMANTITVPAGNKYYGGSAMVESPIGETGIANLEKMALLNMDPTSFFWVNPNHSENDVFSNAYYRRRDKTNILIQYDLT